MSLSGIGPSPIQSVLLASLLNGPGAGEKFTATSLPGHLLHYVLSGRVRQQCSGRSYDLVPGSVLWYHEDEWVEGVVLEAPWKYYSINFIAPGLLPPSFQARLFFSSPPNVQTYFFQTVSAWHDQSVTPHIRTLRVYAHLHLLLDELISSLSVQDVEIGESSALLWWKIETKVRRDLKQELGLKQLEQWSGCSAATIARASQVAVGSSPMRRIKQIRLSFARGLVQLSDLPLSQIAERIGYARVHEFSRDYKAWFGLSPSEERRKSGTL